MHPYFLPVLTNPMGMFVWLLPACSSLLVVILNALPKAKVILWHSTNRCLQGDEMQVNVLILGHSDPNSG